MRPNPRCNIANLTCEEVLLVRLAPGDRARPRRRRRIARLYEGGAAIKSHTFSFVWRIRMAPGNYRAEWQAALVYTRCQLRVGRVQARAGLAWAPAVKQLMHRPVYFVSDCL